MCLVIVCFVRNRFQTYKDSIFLSLNPTHSALKINKLLGEVSFS